MFGYKTCQTPFIQQGTLSSSLRWMKALHVDRLLHTTYFPTPIHTCTCTHTSTFDHVLYSSYCTCTHTWHTSCTTYVNVHRCQEVDGRVQVLMVERPSSLKLRNKQQVHVCRNYGSDQYIKNYYTMCHPMMECLFNELKQSTMRKSSSRKKVLSLSRRNSSTPVTCALMPH